MITYDPQNTTELFIENKEELAEFTKNCLQTNNFNIAIIGPQNSNKSHICKFIINTFFNICSHNLGASRKIDRHKIIYEYKGGDDLNNGNGLSDLNIFCQSNVNSSKLVYIEHYDELSENQQQLIKTYIDKYSAMSKINKTYFLIRSTSHDNIKDIILTRMNIYENKKLGKNNIRNILLHLCEKYNIKLSLQIIDYISSLHNISIHNICTLLTRIYITYDSSNTESLDIQTVSSILNVIDLSLFDKYIDLLQQNKFRDSCNILNELYIDGYDLSDIYFYFYSYLKGKVEIDEITPGYYYEIIERLCFYINEMYKGYYDSFMIYIFTLDIYNILNPNMDDLFILN